MPFFELGNGLQQAAGVVDVLLDEEIDVPDGNVRGRQPGEILGTRRGRVVGTVGVIGPTRMAYERVIPVVDIAARMLGSALNSRD